MQLPEFLNRVATILRSSGIPSALPSVFASKAEAIKDAASRSFYVAAVEGLRIHKGISTLRELQTCFPEIGRTAWGQLEDDGGKGPTRSKLRKILEQETPNKVLPFDSLKDEIRASTFTQGVNEELFRNGHGLSRCQIAWIEVAIANGWFDDGAGRFERLEIYSDTLGTVRDFASRQTRLLPIEGLDFIGRFEALKFNELSELIYDFGPTVVAARLAWEKKSTSSLMEKDGQTPRFPEIKKLMSPLLTVPSRGSDSNGFNPGWLVLLLALMAGLIFAISGQQPGDVPRQADNNSDPIEIAEGLFEVGMFSSEGRSANLVPRFVAKPHMARNTPISNVYIISDSYGGLFLFHREVEDELISLVGSNSTVVSLAWDTDKQRLFAGNNRGEIWTWELDDLDFTQSNKVHGHLLYSSKIYPVGHLNYLSESERLVCHNHNGVARLISSDGKLLAERVVFSAYSTELGLSSDGDLIAISGADSGAAESGDYSLKLYDDELNLLQEFETDEDRKAPSHFVFAGNDRIAAAYANKEILVWDVSNGSSESVGAVESRVRMITSDGTSIALVTESEINYCDGRGSIKLNKELAARIDPRTAIDFDPARKEFLCCGNGYRLFWNLNERAPVDVVRSEFTRSSRHLLLSNGSFICQTQDGVVFAFDPDSNRHELITSDSKQLIHDPTTDHLLVLKENTVEIYNEKQLVTLFEIPAEWKAAALHPKGHLLAFGGANGAFSVYDLTTESWQECTSEPERYNNFLLEARDRDVSDLVWHPTEDLCVVGLTYVDRISRNPDESYSAENALRLWRPGFERLEAIDSGADILRDAPYPILFAGNGEFLVTGTSYGRLGIWNYESREFSATNLMQSQMTERHEGRVGRIGISSDSRYFSSLSSETGLLVWTRGRRNPDRVLESRLVRAHCWAGGKLFIGDTENNSWLYDPRESLLTRLPIHNRSVYRIAASDKFIAVSHRHGVAIFDNETFELIRDHILLSDGDSIVVDSELNVIEGSKEKLEQLFLIDESGKLKMSTPAQFVSELREQEREDADRIPEN
ncbi:MAG: WD40 repeat domain-containing protein [Planctomycetota bacterium]